jgi:hypothetical protein
MWGALSDERTCLLALPRAVVFYFLRFVCSLFVASYDSQGYGGGIRPPNSSNSCDFESESYITTDSQSASLSWNKAPIWGLRPYFYVRQLRFCDVGRSLWWENGSVVYNCCCPSPAQSFSGPSPVGLVTIFYCLRFETSFLSPPTTHRATVEVFDRASNSLILLTNCSSFSNFERTE